MLVFSVACDSGSLSRNGWRLTFVTVLNNNSPCQLKWSSRCGLVYTTDVHSSVPRFWSTFICVTFFLQESLVILYLVMLFLNLPMTTRSYITFSCGWPSINASIFCSAACSSLLHLGSPAGKHQNSKPNIHFCIIMMTRQPCSAPSTTLS